MSIFNSEPILRDHNDSVYILFKDIHVLGVYDRLSLALLEKNKQMSANPSESGRYGIVKYKKNRIEQGMSVPQTKKS